LILQFFFEFLILDYFEISGSSNIFEKGIWFCELKGSFLLVAQLNMADKVEQLVSKGPVRMVIAGKLGVGKVTYDRSFFKLLIDFFLR